ncbi:translation initiation factor eif-2b subunitbeta [Lichtheimia corymbifera JMRC:FSU:9682]|uniref:Translation initiation factor eIF2B subunit beta n=1 Tax=Lichtheimia corymbifera JMRC:FSU:9682 TaxID=1263082 RepID=A0A068RTN9_9FUNG|nr:translation initiation factor eif-2b subunitbeta [Lichtheimia corymbifera JMRC:FSU:9682]
MGPNMTLPTSLEAQVENFITRLKRRQVIGSYEVAKETAVILRQVVSMSRWRDADTLVDIIRDLGGRLTAAQPKELAVGNIVRRVLKVIREVARGELETHDMMEEDEHDESGSDEDEDDNDEPSSVKDISATSSQVGSIGERPQIMMQSSMFRLLAADVPEDASETPEKKAYTLKPLIIQEINEEIIADLETVYKGIADQAVDYIHANEVIMTIGKSRTVEEFLIRAAQKRKFQVIVAETAPTYQGHDMAAALSKAGIDTTVIVDSAIFAAMPRVNKVVLGSHAVLANGALVAVTGSQLLAAAAKHHATPVLVCTALYKLSPVFAYDAETFNITVAPNSVLDFQQGPIIDKVSVSNPYYDYVAPELVSLFVHNLGSAPPTYVYRLINDNYDPEDTTL